MPEATLKRIVVFGGGRWARILLGVLRQVLSDETEILCVSRHCFSAAENWLKQNPVSNLQLVNDLDLAASAADAVIIATSPENHYRLTRQAVDLGLPTLCEKPVASTLIGAMELFELAKSTDCPLGLNLEFLYASYLQDFAELVRTASPTSIHIDWLDAWSEGRGAATKYGEFYTDVMSDQLPHCWSVLSAILPEKAGMTIREIRETAAGVDVVVRFGALPVTCRLGRRAKQRIRRVSVNDGEWLLDFSQEPGVVVQGGVVTSNNWTGDRPLSRSLRGFVEVAAHPERQQHWPLALTNCFDAVQSSLIASDMLRTVQDKRLQEMQMNAGINLENPEHVRIVVDRFLPEFAELGQRFPVRTIEEQKSFVKTWMSTTGKE